MPADCVADLMSKGYTRAEAESTCSEAGQRKAVATKAVSTAKRRDDIKLSDEERKKYGISDETYAKARNREFYKSIRKK